MIPGGSKGLAWVHPDQAKARKAIPAPLNRDGLAVINKQTGRHPAIFFCYRGRAIP